MMSQEIIQMAKDIRSTKVIMALCVLLIHYPNIYRIDMPLHTGLVAHRHTTDKVAGTISVDLISFQVLPDLIASMHQLNPSTKRFECSLFDGEYATGGMDTAYFDHLEGIWSENMKTKCYVTAGRSVLDVSRAEKGH